MAATMSMSAQSWQDFDKRVTKLETVLANRGASASAAGEKTQSPMPGTDPIAYSEFVRRDEFRLFKWLAPLAIALILGGFGLLYQQTSALRAGLEALRSDMERSQGESRANSERIRGELAADMERLRGELAADMERLRGDVAADIERLRGDVAADIERVRAEIFQELERVRADLSKEIAEVRERVVRLEARFDASLAAESRHAATAEPPAGGSNARSRIR